MIAMVLISILINSNPAPAAVVISNTDSSKVHYAPAHEKHSGIDSIYIVPPPKSPGMIEFFKDITPPCILLFGIVGIFLNALTFRNSTNQRISDQKWKRMNFVREILEKLRSSKQCSDALMMIDWSGKAYKKDENNVTSDITYVELINAFPVNAEFETGDDAIFIRDSFDVLFGRLGEINRYIEFEQIEFDDVRKEFEYIIEKLTKHNDLLNPMLEYMTYYRFNDALTFFKRYEVMADYLKARALEAERIRGDK